MDELPFPQFDKDTLDFDLWMVAGIASVLGIARDAEGLLVILREHAMEVMLHSDEDDTWCLHLGQIVPDDHGMRHDNLIHLLVAGIAHTLAYKQRIRHAAVNN